MFLFLVSTCSRIIDDWFERDVIFGRQLFILSMGNFELCVGDRISFDATTISCHHLLESPISNLLADTSIEIQVYDCNMWSFLLVCWNFQILSSIDLEQDVPAHWILNYACFIFFYIETESKWIVGVYFLFSTKCLCFT